MELTCSPCLLPANNIFIDSDIQQREDHRIKHAIIHTRDSCLNVVNIIFADITRGLVGVHGFCNTPLVCGGVMPRKAVQEFTESDGAFAPSKGFLGYVGGSHASPAWLNRIHIRPTFVVYLFTFCLHRIYSIKANHRLYDTFFILRLGSMKPNH